MAESKKSNELTLTRVYDAPLEAVWEAWTVSDQVAQWWGPRGFTITTHSKQLEPGGAWVFTMHGPDGVDYPNTCVYLEVVKHARLVYDHGADRGSPPLFRVTVLFARQGDQTRMQMTMALPTTEAAEQTRTFVKRVGGETTWDRLGEHLATALTGQNPFIINRVFEAPLELMFELWTDPRHLAQWSAPKGARVEYRRADIRPGGGCFYVMTGPATMYGRVSYLEVRRPDRIVYTQQFCDEHENLARHPLAPQWPATMLTTVTLAAEGPTHTRVTVTWLPYQTTLAEELAVFARAKSSMTQGWTGSFDGLEAYLAQR